MTLEDDSLNGTYVVQENILPTSKVKSPTTKEKVEKFLSDGKWHSMKNIMIGTGIGSTGNMFNILYVRLKGDIEIGVCDHCDSVTKLHRLKRVIGKKRK